MKFAYINPTIIAVDDVPEDILSQLTLIAEDAHGRPELNEAGNDEISVRGGQQIQLLPSKFLVNIDVLKIYVEAIAQQYLDALTKQNSSLDFSQLKPVLNSAWTIKQGPGCYQALHTHQAVISGNIYIEVPEFENKTDTDGCIDFKIPGIKNPATFTFVDNWRFPPAVGKSLVFPSHIPHVVYPWQGTGHRIVIAWDAILTDTE
jgi:hypothetical protein